MVYQEPIKKTGRSVKHPHKQSNSVCTAYYNEVTKNNARQTMPQHVLWHIIAAAAKPRRYKEQAPPRKKKLLVAEIHREDQDISAKALKNLWKLQQFNKYPIRDKFRAVQNGSIGLVNFKLIFPLHRYLMTKLSRYLISFFLKRF